MQNKSFWVRTLSGVIMTAVLITVFVLGGYVMWAFLMLLALVGEFEFNRALKLHWGVFAWVGYIATVAYYVLLLVLRGSIEYTLLIFAILLVLDLAVFVITFPRYTLEQTFAGFFNVFYVGVALSFLYIVRIHPPSGAYLVWLVIICSWGCDIFAYLVGMLFGKHPFVPSHTAPCAVASGVAPSIGTASNAAVTVIVTRFPPEGEIGRAHV